MNTKLLKQVANRIVRYPEAKKIKFASREQVKSASKPILKEFAGAFRKLAK